MGWIVPQKSLGLFSIKCTLMYLNFVTLSLNFSKKAKDNATPFHKHQIKI